MENFNKLINSPIPVLVDFFAEWCGPCKAMKPVLEEVKHLMGDKVKIIKIDVDKYEQLALRFDIRTIPTLIVFKEGQQLWRQSGVMRTSQLVHVLQELT